MEWKNYFKIRTSDNFVENLVFAYSRLPRSRAVGLKVPRVEEEQLCVACGLTVKYEFV